MPRGVATARDGVWTAIRPTSLTTSVRDPGAAGIPRMAAFGGKARCRVRQRHMYSKVILGGGTNCTLIWVKAEGT